MSLTDSRLVANSGKRLEVSIYKPISGKLIKQLNSNTDKYTITTMGVIYRLTSPSGKKYYGQTTMTAEKRWYGHLKASQDERFAHYALYVAVRKYGWDNFTKEVVLECEDWELDFYEITYIKDDDTLVPNGYNILPGGRFNMDEMPIEYREFITKNLRKHKNYDLPPGVSEINLPERGDYGFKVFVAEKTHDFISKHQTMEEKLQQALECYNIVKAGGEYRRANHHKWDKKTLNELGLDVPEGIKYRKDKDGFEVHVKIDNRIIRKTFTNKKQGKRTREQNLELAIEYLNNLRAFYEFN